MRHVVTFMLSPTRAACLRRM